MGKFHNHLLTAEGVGLVVVSKKRNKIVRHINKYRKFKKYYKPKSI